MLMPGRSSLLRALLFMLVLFRRSLWAIKWSISRSRLQPLQISLIMIHIALAICVFASWGFLVTLFDENNYQ